MYYDGKEVFSKLKTGEVPQLAAIVASVDALIRDRKLSHGEDPGPRLAAPAAQRRQGGAGKKKAAKDLDEVAAEETEELRRMQEVEL